MQVGLHAPTRIHTEKTATRHAVVKLLQTRTKEGNHLKQHRKNALLSMERQQGE